MKSEKEEIKKEREREALVDVVLYEAMGMGNCACLELRPSFFSLALYCSGR